MIVFIFDCHYKMKNTSYLNNSIQFFFFDSSADIFQYKNHYILILYLNLKIAHNRYGGHR